MGECALRNLIKQVVGKLQNAESVAEPLTAADVIPLVFDVSPNYEVQSTERKPFQSTLGRRPNLTGTVQQNMTFAVELKGAGVQGQRPNYARYLMASGFSEAPLVELTLAAPPTGVILRDTLLVGDISGAIFRVFHDPKGANVLVCVKEDETPAPMAVETFTGSDGQTGSITSINQSYGWGFEPHSRTTRTIKLTAAPAYQPGEHILGSVSGALGRVVYMGSDLLWYEPLNALNFSVVDLAVTGLVSGAAGAVAATEIPQCALPTPPLTLQVNQDGVIFRARGMRGKVNFNFRAVGEPVRMEFEFSGVKALNPFDGVAFPELDDSLIPPRFMGAGLEVGDITAPLTGVVPVVSQMNIQVENTVSPRLDATDPAGLRSFIISDRAFTGGFDPEMTLVNEYDWHGNWFVDQLRKLFATILGPTPVGNTVEFHAPRMQIASISQDAREEILIAGSTFTLTQVKGDDSLILVVK